MRYGLLGLALAPLLSMAAMAQPAPALQPAVDGKVLEKSLEHRFQLDLTVDQAALNKFLPAGWESQIATQGGGKGCNLRLIFVERGEIEGPDNKVAPTGHDVLAVLEAPVRPAGGADAAPRGANG